MGQEGFQRHPLTHSSLMTRICHPQHQAPALAALQGLDAPEEGDAGPGVQGSAWSQLSMPGISCPPGAGSIWNGLPSACTYHAPPSTQAWQLGRVSGWDATRVLLAILTKKSKLKRKRKYLMTLTQADPILRPWSSLWREEAGRSGQGGTGRGRREREPMLVGANHLTTTHGGSTNVMSHFMAL